SLARFPSKSPHLLSSCQCPMRTCHPRISPSPQDRDVSNADNADSTLLSAGTPEADCPLALCLEAASNVPCDEVPSTGTPSWNRRVSRHSALYDKAAPILGNGTGRGSEVCLGTEWSLIAHDRRELLYS